MQKIVAEQLQRTLDVLSDVEKNAELHALLVNAAREAAKSLQNDHKLMVVGNGGSDADAQNLVAKFVSRLVKDRPALSAVALTTDASILTLLEMTTDMSAHLRVRSKLSGSPRTFFWQYRLPAILPTSYRRWNSPVQPGL